VSSAPDLVAGHRHDAIATEPQDRQGPGIVTGRHGDIPWAFGADPGDSTQVPRPARPSPSIGGIAVHDIVEGPRVLPVCQLLGEAVRNRIWMIEQLGGCLGRLRRFWPA
jgi:hypothetical protein